MSRGGLRADIDALEEELTAPASDEERARALRRLGESDHLDFLFQLEMRQLVRAAPREDLSPARLLRVAASSAAVGALPLATPWRLRRFLNDLEEQVRATGAWRPDTPMGWAPLPTLGFLEKNWEQVCRACGDPRLPSSDELGDALGAKSGAAKRLVWTDFMSRQGIEEVWRELGAINFSGNLELELGTTGSEHSLPARRFDAVLYLSGLEPLLLATAPRLATLIQWGLAELPRRLQRALGQPLFAPRRAMLARYPAPSEGYAPHMDNPGGEEDNGRTLTLVVYLNPPSEVCEGGCLALWEPGGSVSEAAVSRVRPEGGTAALFDSRSVPHAVEPLQPGPARWALTFWLNDAPRGPLSLPLPEVTATDALLPVPSLPLPDDRLVFHELGKPGESGILTVYARGTATPRVGIVCTTYGAGRALESWCAHHFDAGVSHLILVFDKLHEPEEKGVAERLRQIHGAAELTIWDGAELPERWRLLSGGETQLEMLLRHARSGSSSYGVSARQTLNASAALAAARHCELGSARLDWLVHLDSDELLFAEGVERGGESLESHFAAAEAAGFGLLRFVNHELLLPSHDPVRPRFKVNPAQAMARLGRLGWRQIVDHLGMEQSGRRPYFSGYFNGKSAVAVGAGLGAAGVHGWRIETSAGPERFLAGPSVLHFRYASAEAFRHKYLDLAASMPPEGELPFAPCAAEEAALTLIASARRDGLDPTEVAHQLDELHASISHFTEAEIELLDEAGTLFEPRLSSSLTPS